MKKNIFQITFIGIFCWSPFASGKASPSLCSGSEEILFTCQTGKKIASVCASRDFTANKGYIQYRFGTLQKREISIPANLETLPKESSVFKSAMFSGGGGANLIFSVKDIRYVVYTAIGKGWGVKEGILVTKQEDTKSKQIANIRCTGQVISELGEALFKRAELKEFAGDFQLP